MRLDTTGSDGMPEPIATNMIHFAISSSREFQDKRAENSLIDPKQDKAWERSLDLVLAPHPNLTAGQRRAVALDYRMKRGRIVLRTRQALAFYVLRQLGLDQTTSAPGAQHIVLVNREEIEPLLNSHE